MSQSLAFNIVSLSGLIGHGCINSDAFYFDRSMDSKSPTNQAQLISLPGISIPRSSKARQGMIRIIDQNSTGKALDFTFTISKSQFPYARSRMFLRENFNHPRLILQQFWESEEEGESLARVMKKETKEEENLKQQEEKTSIVTIQSQPYQTSQKGNQLHYTIPPQAVFNFESAPLHIPPV